MSRLIAWWKDWRGWRQACREYAWMHEPHKIVSRYDDLRRKRLEDEA